MRIKSITLSVIFKLLIIAAAAIGLGVQSGIFEGRLNLAMYEYYTNLSNLLVLVYFIADIAFVIKKRDGGAVLLPELKGACTMGITVTWLVSHFLLGGFTMGGNMWFTILLVHYVVPIMTILDWLLFDAKGYMKAYSPLIWTLFPLAYFGVALISAELGSGLGVGNGSRYPYPFMDVDALGWGTVLITTVILIVCFVSLGYIYFGADRLLLKLGKRISKDV